MNYTVRLLARAQQDVDSIYDWLHAKSPAGAAQWYAAFIAACQAVVIEPYRFALAEESVDCSREIREFLFKTRRGRRYRGLFAIEGDAIFILRVRGPGQPPLSGAELQ